MAPPRSSATAAGQSLGRRPSLSFSFCFPSLSHLPISLLPCRRRPASMEVELRVGAAAGRRAPRSRPPPQPRIRQPPRPLRPSPPSPRSPTIAALLPALAQEHEDEGERPIPQPSVDSPCGPAQHRPPAGRAGPLSFRTVRSVRIRSTTLDRLLHGLSSSRSRSSSKRDVRAWAKFIKQVPGEWEEKLKWVRSKCMRQEKGTNLCAYYVCENIRMITSKRSRDERNLWLNQMREQLLPTARVRAIQK